MPRTYEIINQEACGCHTQVIIDTWMGEPIVYENPVICSEQW